MTRYKFDPHRGLVDYFGNCILQIVPVGCTKKFRNMAGKELANKLNGIEQSWEAAAESPCSDASDTNRYRTAHELKPGDKIKDNDPRMTGRVLQVETVERCSLTAKNIYSGRPVSISLKRIFTDDKRRHTGFSLVC